MYGLGGDGPVRVAGALWAPRSESRLRQPRLLRGADDVAVLAPPGVELAEPLSWPDRCFKRTVDLVLAVILVILALPVIVFAAMAIVLESGGPVLFSQPRVGEQGRVFRVLKLRTMRPGSDAAHRNYIRASLDGGADQRDGLYKAVDDPRITRVGRLLRRTSIDELPQLWNVLRGEMSLVGPRPATVFEAELYDADAWRRFRGRPGLTGLWQVNGRSLLSYDAMLQLDATYWESWSPLLELKIICKTLPAVLLARGAG